MILDKNPLGPPLLRGRSEWRVCKVEGWKEFVKLKVYKVES
jgi:hypothetical protein